jgi:hypothetical protein
MPGGHQHRNARGLCGAHHGLHIVLGKNPFDGDSCWPVPGNPTFDRLFDRHEPACHIQVGGRTHDIHRYQQWLTPGNAVDHAQTASGQARVDPQHPHACP